MIDKQSYITKSTQELEARLEELVKISQERGQARWIMVRIEIIREIMNERYSRNNEVSA